MRGNFSADRVQPFVAVSVVEVPMRIDQMFDRIVAKTRQRFNYSRFCAWYTGIDKEFSIPTREHGDISAGTFKNADIAAQLRDRDLRVCRRITNRHNRTFGGGEQSAGHQPNAGSCNNARC